MPDLRAMSGSCHAVFHSHYANDYDRHRYLPFDGKAPSGRSLSNPSDYIPDFIIDIFEPIIVIIIFFFAMLHPRVPLLAIAALIIARF